MTFKAFPIVVVFLIVVVLLILAFVNARTRTRILNIYNRLGTVLFVKINGVETTIPNKGKARFVISSDIMDWRYGKNPYKLLRVYLEEAFYVAVDGNMKLVPKEKFHPGNFTLYSESLIDLYIENRVLKPKGSLMFTDTVMGESFEVRATPKGSPIRKITWDGSQNVWYFDKYGVTGSIYTITSSLPGYSVMTKGIVHRVDGVLRLSNAEVSNTIQLMDYNGRNVGVAIKPKTMMEVTARGIR